MYHDIKTKHTYLLVLLFLGIFVSQSDAQRRRKIDKKKENIFSVGLMVGVNKSQIDGDFFTGFDKFGFIGGIKGFAYINPKVNLNVEILYTEKGSQIPHGTVVRPSTRNDRLVALDFVEIPLTFQYKPQPDKYNTYLEVGAVLGSLIDVTVEENGPNTFKGTVYNEIKEDFGNFEYGVLAGLGFDYKIIEVALRYNIALSEIYQAETTTELDPFSLQAKEVSFLRNYYVALMLTYKI